jgi:hypothetical protein
MDCGQRRWALLNVADSGLLGHIFIIPTYLVYGHLSYNISLTLPKYLLYERDSIVNGDTPAN